MSQHTATVEWRRGDAPFGTDYDRTHVWRFDGGVEVPASSAPTLSGDPLRVDPEEAFVASLSSCHMMWFLYLAAEQGLVVDRYHDDAVATMDRLERGRRWLSTVDLRPVVDWQCDEPDASVVAELHRHSHERCFIANSVRSTVTLHGAELH